MTTLQAAIIVPFLLGFGFIIGAAWMKHKLSSGRG